jgi:hypothetical protein
MVIGSPGVALGRIARPCDNKDARCIMAAAAEPLLMTVDEYHQLPDREDVVQELHWGMVVTLSRPKMKHAKLQSRLARLLRPVAEHLGVVETEVAFRALPEYDLRGADVAYVSQQGGMPPAMMPTCMGRRNW